jgi:hypothetical protein
MSSRALRIRLREHIPIHLPETPVPSTPLLATAVALTSVLAALPAAATTYRLVDLGESTQAFRMNGHGDVAGSVADRHAAIYADGAWREKRGSRSVAYGIDTQGDLVGLKTGLHHIATPMYYPHGGHRVAIPLPDGADFGNTYNDHDLQAIGLSPDGTQVAGAYWTAADHHHCYQWHPGDPVATDIGLPEGFGDCWAWDVNDAGQVVGSVSGPDGSAAFVFQDGRFTLVNAPSANGGQLRAVNRKGHAAGTYGFQAAYWNGRHFKAIPASGSLYMQFANAINDRDDIIGSGSSGIVMFKDGALVDVVPQIADAGDWNFEVWGQPTGIDDHGDISGTAGVNLGNGEYAVHGYLLVPQD